MFTIQTIPMTGNSHVMILAHLTIPVGNIKKVEQALKNLTKLEVGEEWILKFAEKRVPTQEKVAAPKEVQNGK